MIYLFYEVSNIDWYTPKDINFSGFKDQNITMHVVDSLVAFLPSFALGILPFLSITHCCVL